MRPMSNVANLPAEHPERNSEPKYYVTDHAKAGYSEIFRMAKKAAEQHPVALIGFAVILAHKLFGRSYRRGAPFLLEQSHEVIELTAIPADIRQNLESLAKPLVAAGFAPAFAMRFRRQNTTAHSLVLEHSNHLQVATVMFMHARAEHIEIQRTIANISSERSDESTISTTNRSRGMNFPPDMIVDYLPGANVERLIEAHRRRIAAIPDIVTVRAADMLTKVEEKSRKFVEYQVKRGLYAPATEAEIAASAPSIEKLRQSAKRDERFGLRSYSM